jgi:mannose/cellobiose epimerase-like protein (N-acyl-D-glucosamine 2-epimerase family)
VKDPQRDTYDQCFVLLALAWLWKATKWPEARVWAERTIAYMDDHLVDRAHGGFYESSLRLDYRRANPHMHYLEAMQAWYEVTGERAFLDRAQTAVELFKSVFFESRKLERDRAFQARLVGAHRQACPVEPGHHYEWVWLLLRQARFTGSAATEGILPQALCHQPRLRPCPRHRCGV